MSGASPSVTRHPIVRALAFIPWWVWAVTSVALVFRLASVGYGLPYEFDPDEHLVVDAAWGMVERGSLDPGWYAHPASTLLDVLAALYAAYGMAGVLMGALDSLAGAGAAYHADVTHFFAIGRIVSAVSGVAVVLLTYALTRELRSPAFWAATAALLVALSLPMIQFSSIVRADTLLVVFMLAIVLVMIRSLDRPSGTAFALAGVLLGLAVTSKYPGLLGVVPIVAANVILVFERRVTPRRGLTWLAAAAAASLVAAAVVAPHLFLNYWEALTAIKSEAASVTLGATGAGPIGNLYAYLTDALPWTLSLLTASIGVVGLLVMLTSRRPRLVALTFLAFLAFISGLSLWWLRWALPLVPFVAIGAAFLLWRAELRLRALRPGRWLDLARVAAAGLLVVPMVGPTVSYAVQQATNDDTRIRAIEWVYQNVPDGSTILIDSYTTQVSSDRYDVLIADDGKLTRWSEVSPKLRPHGWFDLTAGDWFGTPAELLAGIKAEGVDYVVLTNLWIDLFRADATTYPDQLAVYEALLEAYPVVASFDADDAPLGWPLLILRASGDATAGGSGAPRRAG